MEMPTSLTPLALILAPPSVRSLALAMQSSHVAERNGTGTYSGLHPPRRAHGARGQLHEVRHLGPERLHHLLEGGPAVRVPVCGPSCSPERRQRPSLSASSRHLSRLSEYSIVRGEATPGMIVSTQPTIV